MKTPTMVFCAGIILIMMSCENPMSFRTKVNEDGSLEKAITFEKGDGELATNNAFGISEKNGWSLKKEQLPQEKNSDKKEYRIQFNKNFKSADEMNNELDINSDSLFHIHSTFEKKYRWFYSYIKYSETIRPINRFKLISPTNYFNLEDSAFIQRLPAEGKSISKADSLYLDLLNEKITDRFATMGMYLEYYQAMEEVVKKNSLGNQWLDTLRKNKDLIYQQVTKGGGNGESDFNFEKVLEQLKISLPKEKAAKDFATLTKDFNSRLNFMSFARDGKYLNEFEMPWTVIYSNADSVEGNKLYWKPLVHKFVYMDYEMFAESRKINLWETVISVVILALTAFVLTRSSKS
ncbi:MAG: hypothetical protein HY015_10985 [Bacteroidetes bacterium]|nr:hypothetical protein [Bacteroidota bacterium]MBI3483475.1 hypothetical protein [Bacteroidota bacterium]